MKPFSFTIGYSLATFAARFSNPNSKMNNEVFIMSIARTPIGSLGGTISSISAIQLGSISVKAAMESMSNAPYYMTKARFGYRYGNGEIIDAIVRDGLQDPYNMKMMGNAGELCAREYKITREEQDAFAVESYKRAEKAMSSGVFKE